MPGFILKTRVGITTRNPRVLAELAQGFLRGVIASNRVIMRERRALGRPLPELYHAGVEYRPEPWAGRYEEFADCLTVLRRGWGDCDDLAAWRCAELQELGDAADIRIYWRKRDPETGTLTMHVEVRRGSQCEKCGAMQQTGQPPSMIHGVPKERYAICLSCRSKSVPWGRVEDPSRHLGL